MPLTSEQRQRVLASIATGRLRLDTPPKMYAGYGSGGDCMACGEVIDKTQVEYEVVFLDGQSVRVHLGCAGVWEAARRRQEQDHALNEDCRRNREEAQAAREKARATAKDSAQLRDQADVLAREAEAVIEKSRRAKRGERPGQ